MKKIIITSVILVLVAIIACNKQDVKIPDDLESKKTLLADKKSELRDLQRLINDLSDQVKAMEPNKEKDPIPVTSQKITEKEFRRYIDVQANVLADDIVNVSSEVGGQITKLFVDEGQYVSKGKLIAVTDMQSLENQIAEIETSLSLASNVFERQKRLWDQNVGSEIQYIEAKSNKELLEKSLNTMKNRLAKKNVYAPISGIVDVQFLEQGEMASPGMPIVQILNTSKVKIKANLQESLLGKIKKGDVVDIYFPALDKSIKRKVSLIGRTIDLNNRTFSIEINTSSENGVLKPNLLAQVSINDYTLENAIVIPLAIVKEEVSGEKFVYVISEENGKAIAKKSYIEIGESDEGYVVVENGIDDGDEVVVAGGESLSDNDPVSVRNNIETIN
ncbi:MAG: efflux RND transporter periplasmic adaptor subunit [Saprospiraceae bacterium]|nr:efflux RND transporter periplasmic adaptor subunit [Saprospiraceae bacterium]NNK90447.1 efflux RND transporter periplasmic adaptor subunit [Saprospiraceae bacterium]